MRMINKILLSLIAVLCLDATVTAQNKQVSGTVTDPAGAPVVGATVLVEGTTIGSTTDASGHFSLNAPEDAKLNISFIGYESQQVDVAGRTHIPVSLKEDSAHDRRRGGDRHGHHPFGEDARILRVDRQVGRTDQGARRQRPQRPVR